MCCRVGLPSLTCCGSSSAPRRRRRPEPSELASEVIVHAHRTAESGICTCEPLEAVHSRATLCPWMSTSYHRLSIIQEESPHRRRRVLVVVSNVNHGFARRLVHSPHDLRVRRESQSFARTQRRDSSQTFATPHKRLRIGCSTEGFSDEAHSSPLRALPPIPQMLNHRDGVVGECRARDRRP